MTAIAQQFAGNTLPIIPDDRERVLLCLAAEHFPE